MLSRLVGRAARQAGLGETECLVASHGSVYLAGADLPVEVDELAQTRVALGRVQRLVVDNDTFALLRTGSERPDRVAVLVDEAQLLETMPGRLELMSTRPSC